MAHNKISKGSPLVKGENDGLQIRRTFPRKRNLLPWPYGYIVNVSRNCAV